MSLRNILNPATNCVSLDFHAPTIVELIPKVSTLQSTSLQLSGEPAVYTGLTGVSASFDGDVISSSSLKAPVHYVDDLTISKNEAGNMVFTSPVVEASVVQSLFTKTGEVFTSTLNPTEGDNKIFVNGDLDFKDTEGLIGVKSLTVASGAPTAGYVLSSTDTSGTLAWIPDATGSTPSLSQVLTVSGDGGNKPITNVQNLFVNGVASSTTVETRTLGILKQDTSGFYYTTSNASGIDLNTKFTSDGLILHKVGLGSDITIQNDADNLITLGTATGYADLQVGVLKYTSLYPNIPPSATPNLEEVLTVSGDGGNKNITNVGTIDVNTSLKTDLLVAHSTMPNYPVSLGCPLNMGNYNIGNVNGVSSKTLTTKDIYSTNAPLNINSGVDFKTNYVLGIGNLNSNRCTANILNSDNTLNVINQARDAYHTIVANASGLDLDTKFTSDGLILHKVGAGSDITIQNDASNLITLGTATGYADLQVGVLKYTSLDPNIPPPATPSLSEVIAVSGDAGNQDITNIKDLTAHQLKTAEKIYLGDNVVLSTNLLNGNELVCDAPFTVRNVQATNGMSIYNTNDYLALFEADVPSNQINCYTDGIMKGFGEFESKIITSTGTSGTVIKNADSSFTVDYLGNTKVKELTYESLSPAIPVPSLSDVLISGNSAGLNNINMNSNAITSALSINGIVPEYLPSQEYWVSKNGSNTNIGSIGNPFLTIQKALDVIATFTDGLPRVVNVLQGSYTENLSITKSRVNIVGRNPGGNRADTGCSINGTITINCRGDLDDLNNNNIYISNCQINGSITNTSSTKNRLIISNCYIYGNDQLIYMNNSNDYRFFMDNCYISNESTISTNEMILFSGSGMISITNCNMTQKALGPVVHFNGSSRVDVFAQNFLTSDSSSGQAQSLLKITSNTAKAIGNCAFVYSNSAPKSTGSPSYSCGILMNTPPNAGTVLSLFNNIFSLAGTSGGGTDYAVNQVNANSSFVLFGNNKSTSSNAGQTAHNIIGSLNATKFRMMDVE